ncbi:preprotein translocase subunit SecY [Sutterella massiliensis]|uniref:Protein translocase subunit SecY n=1 Tax=Sutterella massiliensis TaxID=1816689 RepID=A0ABS2DV36_9BURK|nr:preprotein translocase subunit SecY [Sutterella massiliensis]
MATSPSSKQQSGLSKYGDLKGRLIFLMLALVVYRIGAHVPVPGIDPDMLKQLFNQQQGGILGLFNMFSGGALSRFSVFALGIMPYISASIIFQMLSYVLPSLEALRKEGEQGRRKITQYTRYGTLALGLFQGFGIAVALETQAGLVLDPGFMFRITTTVSLLTGTMFLMWLGEQITERGLGNGISIIIFAGIVAGLPNGASGLFQLVSTGAISPLAAIFVIAIVLAVTAFVVFVERGQRRITVNYAKRQIGNRIYGGQSSYLPLKMNMSGVIPPIFASSLILFPATLAGWFTSGDSTRWIRDLAASLSPGQPLYTLLYAALIIFFAYFYTALVFNPKETAENLKKGGAFIPGIRPGEQTARYIDRVLLRLTLGGAAYLVFVCLVPEFLNLRFNVPFYFGGTSLLIVVVVTMDFMSQVQAYMMSHQYENLLRKTNFRGLSRK